MRFSTAQLAAHRSLSSASVELLREIESQPSWLNRAEFDAVQGAIPEVVQPWPTLVRKALRQEMETVSRRTMQLLASLPQRAFDSDLQRFAAFARERPESLHGLLDDETYLESLLTRVDLLLTNRGVKAIELNATAALGGWDMLFVLPRYLGMPLFERFCQRIGLDVTTTDPLATLFEHLIERLTRFDITCRDVVLTASEFGSAIDFYQAYLQGVYDQAAKRVGAHSGRVWLLPFEQLTFDEGTAIWSHPGGRIGAILEVAFPLSDHPALAVALRARTTLALNGPMAFVLGNKSLFAVLSEHAFPADDEERAFVQRHIPWTRRLTSGRTRFADQDVDMLDLCRTAQSELVLKPNDAFGGRGVTIGAETSESDWVVRIQAALQDDRWVVQERLVPVPLAYQSGDTCADHAAVFGVFLTGDRYAGTTVRVMRTDRGSVVNSSRGAEKSLYLEVDE